MADVFIKNGSIFNLYEPKFKPIADKVKDLFLIYMIKLYTEKENKNTTEITEMKPDGKVINPTFPYFFLKNKCL